MLQTLFIFGIIINYSLLVSSNQDNVTDVPDNNDLDNSNYVMPNSSEIREHSQLEQMAVLLFHDYWQLRLLNNPEKATTLGDHRYDDRLTSYSLKSYEKQKIMLNEFLERANQILTLSPEGCQVQYNLQIFIADLQNKLDELMSGSYLFPVSKLFDPAISLHHLLKYVKLEKAKHYWNLISRYRAMEKQIDEQIELMKEGIRTNFTASNFSLPLRHNYRNKSIEKISFYKPFLNISSSISQDEIDEIKINATDAILNFLIPAFEKLDDFIENVYRPSTRSGVGVSSLPNGEEYYRQQLTFHLTDTNVSARDIHAMGLEEVSRISLEMDEVIHSLGLNLSCREFNDFLRDDNEQHFKSEDEALETYRNVLEKVIPPKLLQLFKYIPKKKLEIQSIPKEMSSGPQAYYTLPSPDNSKPGIFFLDTSNLNSITKYDVMTLSLHEGIPGHHFQFSYVMEQEDLPDFRKYGIDSNAYVEGWALYAEYLGYELKLYEDPYTRFGHLTYEMFRACRLVVDTGIHVFGWTRQKAIDYMVEHLAMASEAIVREVDRYITWPGQACSYKYGELKLKQLRTKAEDILGDNFDIKEFHDVILRNMAPLALVEKEIDRFISTSKNSINS